ncbi:ABC transporter ATP-binding protein [Mesotoga sp. H07.pep.5.3]|uniref:ABC transporter ATP-binding protein n=1 Tax=Mesotoga sp. H07.pep.5.3 TaxID=1421003 RepID=UPI000C1A39B4|nr:ATP-binding cassette domain-containing protein [Mesotoga sp. H07.pep.5.3]PIJ62257.1 ABC transporter [Mesotoga sp. H07.pep.5.3]
MSKPVLEINDLKKTYEISETKALDGVALTLFSGEITTLLGENAAGKTTLVKVIMGIEKPDSGSMVFKGEKYLPSGPHFANEKGLGMVPQSIKVVDKLSVIENLILGFRSNQKKVRMKDYRESLRELMKQYSLQLPLDNETASLSTGQRQKLEILRVLQNSPDVIIFDEPTTLISNREKEELFEIITRLRSQGKAIIFITHKLREAYSISDKIVVLRSGKVVFSESRYKTSIKELQELLYGGEFCALRVQSPTSDESLLRVQEVSVEGSSNSEAVKGVSFEARRGEILFVSGVAGNGQEELLDGIFGMRRVLSGRVILDGKDITGLKPFKLRKLGLAALHYDRDNIASCKGSSIRDNLLVYSISNGEWVVEEKKHVFSARKLLRDYGVTFGKIQDPISSLSGGNLQKLLLAREISSDPKVLLLGEPFRGLDVKSLESVKFLLMEAKKRIAIVAFSADVDEALTIADRILIMSEGRVVFSSDIRPGLSTPDLRKYLFGAMEEIE